MKKRARVKTSKIWSISKAELQKLFDEKSSIKQILLCIYPDWSSGNYLTMRQRISEDNIDLTKFKLNVIEFRKNLMTKLVTDCEFSNDEIFCNNSVITRGIARKRIMREKLIPYECLECGISDEYNGKPLTLQLEHINGVNNDHRLENLCFLCPNCHSQTSTWGGRNIKDRKVKIYEDAVTRMHRLEKTKKFSTTKEELQELLLKLPVVAVGRHFNVSDNAIRKRARSLGIDLEIYNFRNRDPNLVPCEGF